jgi:hypothetical protein
MSDPMTRYYLGVEAGWLWKPPAALPPNVGLFVSHRRLSKDGRLESSTPLRRAAPGVSWALDSGGFNEVRMHGRYSFTAEQYVRAVRRYDAEIGGLEWAAPMDWMCEPDQLDRTGLTVADHIRLTVENYLELYTLWWDLEDQADALHTGIPDYRNERSSEFCPIKPAIQGWTLAERLACIDLYEESGVHLADQLVVGLGSVCRLANTTEGVALLRALHAELERRYPGRVENGVEYPSGLSLHLFGVKTTALAQVPETGESADSRAWSMAGMKRGGRCQHPESGVAWEQNCPIYARAWLDNVLSGMNQPSPAEPAPAPAAEQLGPVRPGRVNTSAPRAAVDPCYACPYVPHYR